MKKSKDKNSSVLEQLSLEKTQHALIKLALPAILSVLITALYNVADTFFVCTMNNTAATAAISINFPIFVLIASFGSIFGIGGGTLISRKLGEKKKDDADRVCSISFATIIIFSVLISAAGFFSLPYLLHLFGASETVLPYALSYGRILVSGTVFNLIAIVAASVIRAEGNSLFSMKLSLSGVLLNLVLDPVFIIVLNWGIEGSAYATVISQIVSTFLFVWYYRGKDNHIRIALRLAKPDMGIYRQILNIGIPVFLKQFLLGFSIITVNIFVSAHGDSAVAAMGITLRVTSIGMLVLFGYSAGMQPLAGFAFGAGMSEKLKEIRKISFLWMLVFSLIFSAVTFIFAEEIVRMFSNDPSVIENGKILFWGYVITFPVLGYITLYGSLLESFGAGKYAFVLVLFNQGIFFYISLFAGDGLFGMTGIALSQSASNILSAILTLFIASSYDKKASLINFINDEDSVPA